MKFNFKPQFEPSSTLPYSIKFKLFMFPKNIFSLLSARRHHSHDDDGNRKREDKN